MLPDGTFVLQLYSCLAAGNPGRFLYPMDPGISNLVRKEICVTQFGQRAWQYIGVAHCSRWIIRNVFVANDDG